MDYKKLARAKTEEELKGIELFIDFIEDLLRKDDMNKFHKLRLKYSILVFLSSIIDFELRVKLNLLDNLGSRINERIMNINRREEIKKKYKEYGVKHAFSGEEWFQVDNLIEIRNAIVHFEGIPVGKSRSKIENFAKTNKNIRLTHDASAVLRSIEFNFDFCREMLNSSRCFFVKLFKELPDKLFEDEENH